MITFAKMHDSPSQVAREFQSQHDSADLSVYTRLVREENRHTFAYTAFPGRDMYSAMWPIWVPKKTQPIAADRKAMLTRLEMADHSTHENLQLSLDQGFNLKQLFQAQRLAAHANKRMHEDDAESDFEWVAKPSEWMEKLLHFRSGQIDKFDEAIDKVKVGLKRYRLLYNVSDLSQQADDLAQSAKQELTEAYEGLHLEFSHQLSELSLEAGAFDEESEDYGRYIERGAIRLADSDAVEELVHVGEHIEWLAHGLVWLNVGLDAYQVYNAYEHGGPWLKMAIEDTAEFAAGLIITGLVGLVIGSGGWVVLAAGATLDIAGNMLVDIAVKHIGNSLS